MADIESRTEYGAIKEMVLSAYFDFCRDRGHGYGWSHDRVLGSVEYEFECTFELPVEVLMLKVVELILSGGWHREVESNIRQKIVSIINEHGLEELLEGVSAGEIDEFKHDLEIIRLI
ncbi:hypothetical protein ABH309_23845 [Chromobacterium piscinae]|uniref:Uncharacterized protein n=1 Tax=Chromobacterium piscinae TaxID=686831 RepID=A0ABV0HC52_9NEIS|nr:hypothetical protein [Chromobacterium piscinae]MCD4505199.1 hypothetical protein [Chromobacterium piscinae]